MPNDVMIPALGESVTEATVGQWLKNIGDMVQADEPIVSLETDKVAVDVPSPTAGVLLEQLVAVGDTVAVGAAIARIGEAASAAAAKPDKAAASAPVAAPPATAQPAPAAGAAAPAPDTADGPAVRRLLEQYGIDAASIAATGKDGRITKGDVLAAIEAGTAKLLGTPAAAPAPAPATAAAVSAPAPRHEERVPMTRLRQTIARRLKEAQDTAAILTTFNDVDMTAVIEARNRYRDAFEKKHGVRLGFMSFFVQAAVMALRDVPAVNAMIDGSDIVYRRYADIGVAVSSPGGLVVPILRDADRLGFADTEKAIADFGRRARDGKLAIADMQGGTFTISNGGVFGSLMSTPIINPPQSAVLGMHRVEDRPVVRNGAIVARPMMYLALSYDHRLIDGKDAVTFLVAIKNAIEDPARLLIDL
jgi:2-oxoglutarate dehydrogenase E2 component (dihydrolipoamide succinyltransferase)